MAHSREGGVTEQQAQPKTAETIQNASTQSQEASKSKGFIRRLRGISSVAGIFMAFKALAGGDFTPAQAGQDKGYTTEEARAANDPVVRSTLDQARQVGNQADATKGAFDRAKQEEGWLSQVNKFHELGGIKTPRQSNEQSGQRASSQERDPSFNTLRNLQTQVGKLSDEAVRSKYKIERDAEIIGKSKDPAAADKALREYNKQEENARK